MSFHMKTLAAVLEAMGALHPYADSRPLTIATLDLAPPGQDEVLLKIAAAGLCDSDLSVIKGDRRRPMPLSLGHEAAGVVRMRGADRGGSGRELRPSAGRRVRRRHRPRWSGPGSADRGDGRRCAPDHCRRALGREAVAGARARGDTHGERGTERCWGAD